MSLVAAPLREAPVVDECEGRNNGGRRGRFEAQTEEQVGGRTLCTTRLAQRGRSKQRCVEELCTAADRRYSGHWGWIVFVFFIIVFFGRNELEVYDMASRRRRSGGSSTGLEGSGEVA